uniref:Uncharacterized protein n=1 Tax=Varanus komodoensis TaxID=61221 RepID=A0A8D2LJ86_VARKO
MRSSITSGQWGWQTRPLKTSPKTGPALVWKFLLAKGSTVWPAFHCSFQEACGVLLPCRFLPFTKCRGCCLEKAGSNLDRTELAWDEPSVRDLLNGLDQEIERLESCLSAGRYTHNIRRTVKRYFQQLSSFLEGKEYATCAWKIVQKRVQRRSGGTQFFWLHTQILNAPQQTLQ